MLLSPLETRREHVVGLVEVASTGTQEAPEREVVVQLEVDLSSLRRQTDLHVLYFLDL